MDRPEGISAVVLNRNELTLEDSLRSVSPIVDEVVVVDASTGEHREQAARICRGNPKIKFIHMPPDYTEQLIIGVDASTQRWILKWDADFVATPQTKRLWELVKRLPPPGHYAITFAVENQEPMDGRKLHREPYLFTYHPCLMRWRLIKLYNLFVTRRRGKLPNRDPYTPFPLFYNKIHVNGVYAVHMNAEKLPSRLSERPYQSEWTLTPQRKRRGITFEQFVRNRRCINMRGRCHYSSSCHYYDLDGVICNEEGGGSTCPEYGQKVTHHVSF